jgi:hypothetical protein
METNNKRRLLYVGLTLVTVLCGLGSRLAYVPLPGFVSAYAGDTLWALMVFWCFCIVAPNSKTWKIALAAILFSYAIEFSQFYHGPWIDAVRDTTIGGLVLGFGFKFSDLVCYLTGVLLGAIIHWRMTGKAKNVIADSA